MKLFQPPTHGVDTCEDMSIKGKQDGLGHLFREELSYSDKEIIQILIKSVRPGFTFAFDDLVCFQKAHFYFWIHLDPLLPAGTDQISFM